MSRSGSFPPINMFIILWFYAFTTFVHYYPHINSPPRAIGSRQRTHASVTSIKKYNTNIYIYIYIYIWQFAVFADHWTIAESSPSGNKPFYHFMTNDQRHHRCQFIIYRVFFCKHTKNTYYAIILTPEFFFWRCIWPWHLCSGVDDTQPHIARRPVQPSCKLRPKTKCCSADIWRTERHRQKPCSRHGRPWNRRETCFESSRTVVSIIQSIMQFLRNQSTTTHSVKANWFSINFSTFSRS